MQRQQNDDLPDKSQEGRLLLVGELAQHFPEVGDVRVRGKTPVAVDGSALEQINIDCWFSAHESQELLPRKQRQSRRW